MSLADRFDKQQAQLAAIQATESELIDGPDAALQVLGPPTDPIRVRATLGILLRDKRHQQAADLIHDRHPDEKWIDVGAYIFAFLGDNEHARKLVKRADDFSDPLVMRRTRVAYAEGIVEQWQKRHGDESLLTVCEWPSSDIELADTVIDLLDPLLSLVRVNRSIRGDIELYAVIYAINCAKIAGEEQLVTQYSGWLAKHVPIPLMVAELCLRGFISSLTGLSNRLRVEHPGEFQAAFLAALVDRDVLDQAEDAFDAFVRLSSEARTDEEKGSICIALFETSGKCASHKIDKAIQVVSQLRPDDSRLVDFLKTYQQVAAGNLVEAGNQLEALRDEGDAVWWQARAQLFEKTGDEDEAQKAWERASELLPHPEVIRRSVQASLERRRFESAVRGLKNLLAKAPDDEKDLKTLSWTLVRLGDHAQAAQYLQRLVAIDPTNTEYRLGLAQCLGRSARITEAIDALQPVCDGDDPPLDALLLQSELLGADGRSDDAFRILEPIAADYWDDVRVLMTYMRRAGAAGKDRLANDAFARLIELRRGGKVPSELMQEGSIEQLLEHGRDYRARRESLQTEVVKGRMPWLFAEDVLGNPPTWAWVLHTQELRWLSDERLGRAAFTVYATNGFTVCVTDEVRRLSPIKCPGQGRETVADLSALLTLHQLGRLEAAAEFLGKLLLPASYGDLRIQDADRFGQHQPSREEELKIIRSEIERGRIRIVEGDASDLISVDEYLDDPESHVYRLQDFAISLQAAQKISSPAIQELSRVAHRPSAVDQHHPALTIGAQLVVDLLTLRTLADKAVFEIILDAYTVHLRSTQQDELSSELQAYERARVAKAEHDGLWKTVARLKDREKIEWLPVPQESDVDSDADDGYEEEAPPSIHLDSIKLAKHLEKSVLVDDRALQVLMYQADPDSDSRAFGTDLLLLSMLEAENCTAEIVAADFHRLMRWRYRFLVPPAALLVAWAHESIESLPGDALLDVAVYLHECLRDPGLLCGFEQSDPPMPMAAKFVTAWIDAIVTFLSVVWEDETFSDAAASGLTRWVGEELIPSCPRGLWLHPVGKNLAQMEPSAALSMTMVKFAGGVLDSRRANLGLRVFAESLGINEEAFVTITVESIHAVE